jgi:ABC-type glycerol-3-phosphate transport system permease component
MRADRLIIHVLVIVLALLLLGPFLWLLRMSVETNPQIFAFPAAALLQPDTVQLRCPVADRVSPFVFNSVFVGLPRLSPRCWSVCWQPTRSRGCALARTR